MHFASFSQWTYYCKHTALQCAEGCHQNTTQTNTYTYTLINQALALAKLNGSGNKSASGSATSQAASKQVRQPAQSAPHRPHMSRGQGARRGRGGGGGGSRGGIAARRGPSDRPAWSDESGGSDGDEGYDYDYDSGEEGEMSRSIGGDKARMELGDFVTSAGRHAERSSAQHHYDDLDAEEDRQIQLAMAASMDQQRLPVVVNVNTIPFSS